METIYALSSGAVPSGVAVLRVSGPLARRVLERVAGGVPPPRYYRLTVFRRLSDNSVIDQGLAVWFPAPASFTGEDVAELHVHGGRAVVDALFDVMQALGARLAMPGEFTRRAFSNGKLDLTRAEGLADLVAAETEAQQRQAVGAAQGALFGRAEVWRETLIKLRAEIEARLDFSDEGDVAEDLPAPFWRELAGLREEIGGVLEGARAGERVREGFRVAIVGRPNAGKSTLLNVLAQRDVAIVTAEAGTTRDIVEVSLDLGGYPVLLVDTAGLRDAVSVAEQEGVRRARETAEGADLVLWLEEASSVPEDICVGGAAPVIRVRTKADLRGGSGVVPDGGFLISSVSGLGIDRLSARVEELARISMGHEPALVTRRRQRTALAAAHASLSGVAGAEPEVAADLLRSASEAIGRLTGRVDIEDVLDSLFAEFCIGK